MKLAVSGGGTGGHFFPALAVLQEAEREGLETLYVGAERGIEKKFRDLIPSESVFLKVAPLRGVPFKSKISSSIGFLKGFLKLRSLLEGDFRSLIFGGYVSVPLGIATLSRGKPLFLHEQNSVPGATNRSFFRFARKVFITFEYTRKYFRGENVLKTGLPVRRELLETKIEKEEAKRKLGFDPSLPLILFMGGSQGARFINRLGAEFSKKTPFQTLILSGEREYKEVREAVGGERVKVFPFRKDMGIVYSAVDVAVVRAGSSTLTELSLFKVPALMIPYPFAAGDHQYYNAKEIEELGGGFVLRQEEAELERVIRLVEKILSSRDEMGKNIGRFANPKASRIVLEEVLE